MLRKRDAVEIHGRLVAIAKRSSAELLLSDDYLTITPFPDVEPIRITKQRVQREIDSVYWLGRMQDTVRLPPDVDPQKLQSALAVRIFMQLWDLDERGDARLSSQNRFRFSPSWRFDEQDRPVLRPPVGAGDAGAIGRPPETPEEIARHKELLKLDKHAFGSVGATIFLPGRQRYLLIPLDFTPKYSVIVEEDPSKRIPVYAEPPRTGRSER